MQTRKSGFRSVDEYIATFPEDIQALLESLRATIKAAAPGAEERISYQMPTFELNGYLVYFAAWKNHIGFYPASSGVQEAFKAELCRYATEKGTVRFPLNAPLPLELISKIVQFRVSENLNRGEVKAHKKKA
ncbi:MAG: DUF1801 domain-containing protein [Chloroflexota bacterium]|nr:DUF1801 domain-containing protein [Chloroflexota bacterium]MDQ5865291.1 DUF1801 domain-containing protein [Chloroflexota bacterium]